jgi:hypothetical protein
MHSISARWWKQHTEKVGETDRLRGMCSLRALEAEAGKIKLERGFCPK